MGRWRRVWGRPASSRRPPSTWAPPPRRCSFQILRQPWPGGRGRPGGPPRHDGASSAAASRSGPRPSHQSAGDGGDLGPQRGGEPAGSARERALGRGGGGGRLALDRPHRRDRLGRGRRGGAVRLSRSRPEEAAVGAGEPRLPHRMGAVPGRRRARAAGATGRDRRGAARSRRRRLLPRPRVLVHGTLAALLPAELDAAALPPPARPDGGPGPARPAWHRRHRGPRARGARPRPGRLPAHSPAPRRRPRPERLVRAAQPLRDLGGPPLSALPERAGRRRAARLPAPRPGAPQAGAAPRLGAAALPAAAALRRLVRGAPRLPRRPPGLLLLRPDGLVRAGHLGQALRAGRAGSPWVRRSSDCWPARPAWRGAWPACRSPTATASSPAAAAARSTRSAAACRSCCRPAPRRPAPTTSSTTRTSGGRPAGSTVRWPSASRSSGPTAPRAPTAGCSATSSTGQWRNCHRCAGRPWWTSAAAVAWRRSTWPAAGRRCSRSTFRRGRRGAPGRGPPVSGWTTWWWSATPSACRCAPAPPTWPSSTTACTTSTTRWSGCGSSRGLRAPDERTGSGRRSQGVRRCRHASDVAALSARPGFDHAERLPGAGLLRWPAGAGQPRASTGALAELLADPAVGAGQAVLEAHGGLPAEHLAHAADVGVAAAHALRLGGVVALGDALAGDAADEVDQLVDRDHAVLAEVDGVMVVGLHQPVDALDAVGHVAVGAGLLPVAPDLDLVVLVRRGDLAADGGGGLLPAPLPGPERPEDVVEADHPGGEAVVLAVVAAEPLGHQLLPAVAVLGVRRVGVLLTQRHHLGPALQVAGVDAGRGGVEEPARPVDPCRLQHVRVDQQVVVDDGRLVALDVADAAHVGGQVVDLVRPLGGLQARRAAAQVQEAEVGRPRRLELGELQVDAADPVAEAGQVAGQVVADEAPCPGHQHGGLLRHAPPSGRQRRDDQVGQDAIST